MFIFDNYYSLSELIKTGYSLIGTKLFYPGALLVRRPIYTRGKPRMRFGKGFTTGYGCRLEAFGEKGDKTCKLIFQENCKLGDHVHIAAHSKITIGKNCLMASNIFITDLSHGDYSVTYSDPASAPTDRPLFSDPVEIGDNVWIGENVCILKGVHIGDGSIIGSNAVVTKSISSNSIAVGSPAKVIKRYSEEEAQWVSV